MIPSRPLARITFLAASFLAGVSIWTSAANAAYDPGDPAQKAVYDATLPIAVQGYEFGAPILNMDKTFRISTSVNVPNGRGGGPVNQFSHFTNLANAKDRKVVLPNSDTLYSMAWLDLRKGPVVIRRGRAGEIGLVLRLLRDDGLAEQLSKTGQ